MLKKFSIVVGALASLIAIACSSNDASDIAGGTIDPSTLAANSSSSGDIKTLPVSSAEDVVSSSGTSENNNGLDVTISSSSRLDTPKEESSSSGEGNHTIRRDESSSSTRSMTESSSSDGGDNNGIVPIELSSSSEFRDGGIARTNDFSIRCVDAGDVREQASAYKSVAGDVVVFALQNVQFDIPCDAAERDEYIEFLNADDTFPIGHEGDTLYVRPLQSKGIDYACSCAANATFTLDKNYSGINYTVFDQEQILPVQEN